LAVNVGEVATPFESVVAVAVFAGAELPNVPLAPEDGAVKVTVTPLAGDPPEVTVATSGAANAVLTAALCGAPLVAAIESVPGGVVPVPVPLLGEPTGPPQEARAKIAARRIRRSSDFPGDIFPRGVFPKVMVPVENKFVDSNGNRG
jgi:hypothetical protein